LLYGTLLPSVATSYILETLGKTTENGKQNVYHRRDVLDESPLLDIKPYVKYFDSRDDVVSGWLDNHFKNGNISDETIIK
jgi:hypothetical protein